MFKLRKSTAPKKEVDLFSDTSIEVLDCTSSSGLMEMTNAPEIINGRVVVGADFIDLA